MATLLAIRNSDASYEQADWDALIAQLDTREQQIANGLWDVVLELYNTDDCMDVVIAAINALRVQHG